MGSQERPNKGVEETCRSESPNAIATAEGNEKDVR